MVLRPIGRVLRRTAVAFYDDQMTHHAAALTYYGLMSMFPAALLALSLLGLLGQFPETYDAIIAYLRGVVPASTLGAIDASLRSALESKGTAATAFVIGIVFALYGTTGVLEAARRALNVVFELDGSGRSFLRRKLTDIGSTAVLMALVLATLILMFVGGGFADEVFDLVGLGSTARSIWGMARWPAALGVAMLVFSWIYFVTPDVAPRAFRWITPGAVAGVLAWLLVSALLSYYLGNAGSLNATYGSFASAISLLVWLWLTNCALLFGAELNAEIEREKELSEGVPEDETLALAERG